MPIMTKPAQADGQTALPPLCDAHTHPGEAAEWLERLENGIISLICASTPPEAEALFTHLKRIEGEMETAVPPVLYPQPGCTRGTRISILFPIWNAFFAPAL